MWLSGGGLSRQKNQEIPPSLPHINAAELKIQITADGGPEQKKNKMESERWSFLRKFVRESIKKCSFYVAIFSPCFLSIKSVRHGAFRMRERKKLGKRKGVAEKKSCIPVTFLSLWGLRGKGRKKEEGWRRPRKSSHKKEKEKEHSQGFPEGEKSLNCRLAFLFLWRYIRETAKGERGGFVEKNARR